tara:strand:+ start:403 stop:606 length:204 start_codon:yes stop_codon:yes gene_type:complete
MLDGEKTFDTTYYLNKWKNKNCINQNHKIIIETIGDWDIHTNKLEPIFKYRYMLLECNHCKTSQTIK